MKENALLENEQKLLETSENKINLLVSLLVSTCPWGSLGSLIFRLPSERRKSVHEIEKVSAKVTRLKCSSLFNGTYLKEGILPT